MQVFVQTDRHVVDVSKVAFIETFRRTGVTFHFSDGVKLTLPRDEAKAVLDEIVAMAVRKVCIAIRAKGESE